MKGVISACGCGHHGRQAMALGATGSSQGAKMGLKCGRGAKRLWLCKSTGITPILR